MTKLRKDHLQCWHLTTRDESSKVMDNPWSIIYQSQIWSTVLRFDRGGPHGWVVCCRIPWVWYGMAYFGEAGPPLWLFERNLSKSLDRGRVDLIYAAAPRAFESIAQYRDRCQDCQGEGEWRHFWSHFVFFTVEEVAWGLGWKCGLIYNPHRSAARLAPNPCRNAALIGTIKEWSTKPNQTIIAINANPQIGSGSLFEIEDSAHKEVLLIALKERKRNIYYWAKGSQVSSFSWTGVLSMRALPILQVFCSEKVKKVLSRD